MALAEKGTAGVPCFTIFQSTPVSRLVGSDDGLHDTPKGCGDLAAESKSTTCDVSNSVQRKSANNFQTGEDTTTKQDKGNKLYDSSKKNETTWTGERPNWSGVDNQAALTNELTTMISMLSCRSSSRLIFSRNVFIEVTDEHSKRPMRHSSKHPDLSLLELR